MIRFYEVILVSCPAKRSCSFNPISSNPILTLSEKPFENIEGKGKNADNQHFSPFPSVFNQILDKNHQFNYFL